MKLPWILVVPPPELVRLGKLLMSVTVEDEEGNQVCVFNEGTSYRVVCWSLGIEFFTEQASGTGAVARILKGFYRLKLKDGEEKRLTEFMKMNEE